MQSNLGQIHPYVKFTNNRSIEVAHQIYEQRVSDSLYIFHKYKEEFVDRECPFCGNLKYRQIDHFHGTYTVVTCRRCAGEYTNPVPPLHALEEYYNSCECNKLLDIVYKKRASTENSQILDIRVKKAIEIIENDSNRLSRRLRVLEIGCGSGGFLAKLKQEVEQRNLSVDLEGVDIDKNAIVTPVDESLKLTAIPIESFIDIQKTKFDLILHFELIEHLTHPYRFMQDIKKLLNDGGHVLFTTPNSYGLETVASDYNAFRLIAHAIFPPMHLNAFTIANTTLFAYRLGFNVQFMETPGMLDIDMVCCSISAHGFDSEFRFINEFTDVEKGQLQYLLTRLKASSHMMICLD